MNHYPSRPLRVYVVWEPVLPTDFAAPTTLVMKRLPDARVVQHWDAGRLLSKQLGERPGDRDSIVWDWVAVYPPGLLWKDAPPQPAWSDRPVVDVKQELSKQLGVALGDN